MSHFFIRKHKLFTQKPESQLTHFLSLQKKKMPDFEDVRNNLFY